MNFRRLIDLLFECFSVSHRKKKKTTTKMSVGKTVRCKVAAQLFDCFKRTEANICPQINYSIVNSESTGLKLNYLFIDMIIGAHY